MNDHTIGNSTDSLEQAEKDNQSENTNNREDNDREPSIQTGGSDENESNNGYIIFHPDPTLKQDAIYPRGTKIELEINPSKKVDGDIIQFAWGRKVIPSQTYSNPWSLTKTGTLRARVKHTNGTTTAIEDRRYIVKKSGNIDQPNGTEPTGLTRRVKRLIEFRRNLLVHFTSMIIGEAQEQKRFEPNATKEAERYVDQISEVLIKPLNDLEKETFNKLKYSF